MTARIIVGDCLAELRKLPDEIVHCCVTSPPYWGLRDYGHAGQIGLEPTIGEYIAKMTDVFREVRRVLRSDGTAWVNMGDSYAAQRGGTCMPAETLAGGVGGQGEATDYSDPKRGRLRHGGHQAHRDAQAIGLKHKDLCGIPWRLAFALQADGWWLRQDIIWSKPNPMPESVTDRCTKAHEYIFLLSKSEQYYYDADAIAEPVTQSTIDRLSQPGLDEQIGSDRVPGKTNGNMKAVCKYKSSDGVVDPQHRTKDCLGGDRFTDTLATIVERGVRNKRSVWTVTTQPFKEAHFATFPPALIEPCILAGCPADGTVLDPFGGAGTTALVADRMQRNSVSIELNPAYADMARKRLHNDAPLFVETAA